MAYLYKYDWFVTPYIKGCEGLLDQDQEEDTIVSEDGSVTETPEGKVKRQKKTKENKKYFNGFFEVLRYFENFQIKQFCGQVALKVIRNGCYCGYLIKQSDRVVVQELHPKYCRSRFKVRNRPAIQFNMKYFDDKFPDEIQRYQILNLFPQEFKKGYALYN